MDEYLTADEFKAKYGEIKSDQELPTREQSQISQVEQAMEQNGAMMIMKLNGPTAPILSLQDCLTNTFWFQRLWTKKVQ